MTGIYDRTIQVGKGIYIIAEMACAHDGDVKKAKRLIDAAVSAEADAIQLQFFSRKDLMTPDHEVYELLGKIEFSPQQWGDIFAYARQSPIHVFACTYDVPSAKLAIELGVDGIKLNSSDLSNPDLLEVVAKSGIPYTLGTGGSTVEEIAQAVETSISHGGDQIIIMHGIQNFPTEIQHAQINKMKMLKALFPFPVGYQDHTDASHPFSRVIDLLAIGMGACVVEKHITLDRSNKGTDYQAALEPEELVEFVKMVRTAEMAMGSERIQPLGEKDREYRRFQKKCIVSLESLKAGDVIEKGNIAFLRSGRTTDLSTSDVGRILGKKLKRDVSPYQPLEWLDIQE